MEVVLNSGGPLMQVDRIDCEHAEVYCSWDEWEGESPHNRCIRQQAKFPVAALSVLSPFKAVSAQRHFIDKHVENAEKAIELALKLHLPLVAEDVYALLGLRQPKKGDHVLCNPEMVPASTSSIPRAVFGQITE